MAMHYPIKAGQSLTFSVPCKPEKGWGEFPSPSQNAVLGWTMDDPSVGSLTKRSNSEGEKGCAVVYQHNSSIKGNVLTFTTADGRQEHVMLVPSLSSVHDHSTLAQGGPAYGTYAALVDEEE